MIAVPLAMRGSHAVCFDAATGKEIPNLSGALKSQAQQDEQHRLHKDEVDRQFTEQRDEMLKVVKEAKEQRQAREAAERQAKEIGYIKNKKTIKQ